jgi:hypothetical protein
MPARTPAGDAAEPSLGADRRATDVACRSVRGRWPLKR